MTICPETSTMMSLPTKIPNSLRRHANSWMRFCREFVVAKRGLIKQVVAILQAHPDYPKPLTKSIPISKIHYSRTLEELERIGLTDSESDSDIPLVPTESATSSCCSPPPPKSHEAAHSKPPEKPRAPSRISVFLKGEYEKISFALKYKFDKMFPKPADLINSMLWDIKQLEFSLNLLEMQCDKLQKFFDSNMPVPLLKRRTCALTLSFYDINSHYEKAIDCKSEAHKQMKKYVHNKLAGGEYAGEQGPENPVAGCSGEQNRPSTKSSKENVSTTPQRRSSRSVQASGSAPDAPRESSTSKRTPKHSAKDTREKKKLKVPETEPQPVESNPGRMVQVISRENRDDVDFELSGDSTGETSRDTISTRVYESVEDMALTGSEDDGKKKARPKSTKKTESKSEKASPQKDLAERKDVAKTQSPSTSKHDSKKTGTKPKKLYTKKTRTKSKHGYTSVPQSDSDED